MKKQIVLVSGIIAILIVSGLLYWWYNKSQPTDVEVEAVTKNIKQVDTKILSSKTTQEIENRKVMGNIPVEVSDNYSHNNLFE